MVSVEAAIQSIARGEPSPSDLEEMEALLSSQPQKVFLCASQLAREAGVEGALRLLEQLATNRKELALELLIGLYDVASDAYAHDVCEAIDLWLFHHGTSSTHSFLLNLRRSSECPIPDRVDVWIRGFGDSG